MKSNDIIRIIFMVCFFVFAIYNCTQMYYLIKTQAVQGPESFIIGSVTQAIMSVLTLIAMFYFTKNHGDSTKTDTEIKKPDTIPPEV